MGLFGGITYNGQRMGQPRPTGAKGTFGGGMSMGGQPQEKERAFFDTTRGKISLLGDLLLRMSGNGGNPYVQHMQQQELLNRQQQMAQKAREWGMQDFVEQQRIQAQYAQPDVPSGIREYQYVQGMPEAERENYVRFRRSTRPVIGPDGLPYYPEMTQAPPTAPVGGLTFLDEGGTAGNSGGGF